MNRGLAIITALTLAALIILPGAALAQNKVAKCQNVKIAVDMKSGGEWKTDVSTLALLEQGGGWKIEDPYQRRGEDVNALVGMELRFKFSAGTYPIHVTPSGGKGRAITLLEQKQPHIVLVKANKPTPTAGFAFEITGANSPKAKIGGCPGGSVSIIVE